MHRSLDESNHGCECSYQAGLALLADIFRSQNIDFPIVFIDEAAMCTEVSTASYCAVLRLIAIASQPVTLIPIMKGSCHVTLIGDHMQLPAIVTVSLCCHLPLRATLIR